jgi:hypothetical protein
MAAGARVSRVGIGGVVCAVLCLASGWASAVAAAEPEPGPAGWMYEPNTVVFIDLTMSAEEEAKLEAEPEEYVKGTLALSKTSDGTPAGEEPPLIASLPVEIRLKGNVGGSFRPLTGKAAFKLKFKKAEPLFGLRKMTLNNMVEDFSLIHERLAYEAFRAAGITASRTGYAFVRVNGDDFGIYLNLENLDKVNLERWFGPFDDPQHLYEGEYGTDVKPGEATKFEVDEGDEVERSDLEALIATANASEGIGWSNQVASVADLLQMTQMWAVEKYIGHWDGYSGRAGAKQPNNYYLYSSPTGVFQMLPWGTDMTWEKRVAFDGPAGLMFDKCIADPACAALYREQLRAIGGAIDGLHLGALAEDTAALLKPWEDADPRLEYPLLVDGAVAETLGFIAERPAELAAWLGTEKGSGPPAGSAPATEGPRHPARLRFRGAKVRNGVLTTHLRVPAPGRVVLRATIHAGGGRIEACSAQVRVRRARSLTMRCRLSGAVRRRLRNRRLILSVRTRFIPEAGSPVLLTRRVLLRRTPR